MHYIYQNLKVYYRGPFEKNPGVDPVNPEILIFPKIFVYIHDFPDFR